MNYPKKTMTSTFEYVRNIVLSVSVVEFYVRCMQSVRNAANPNFVESSSKTRSHYRVVCLKSLLQLCIYILYLISRNQVTIRVKLPDRYYLEGLFHASETVSHLIDFVKGALETPSPFDLCIQFY